METRNDVVFTMEISVRTARVTAYTLLDLQKQVPDLSPTQYDIRNLIKAARAINNGEPSPGERRLHRLLDNTYFAHILPSLPASTCGTQERSAAAFRHRAIDSKATAHNVTGMSRASQRMAIPSPDSADG